MLFTHKTTLGRNINSSIKIEQFQVYILVNLHFFQYTEMKGVASFTSNGF